MQQIRRLWFLIVVLFLILFFITWSYKDVSLWEAYNRTSIELDRIFLQKNFQLPHHDQSYKLSPEAHIKIQQLKYDLNDSSITDDAVYPGLRLGRYIMMNPHLCRDVDRVDVIIMVHTAPKHLDKRQRMRDSYAKESLFLPFHVKIVFLLGTTMDKDLSGKLTQEHYQHNDTVMADFVDDYHNLTLKGTMGYQWISQYCSNAKLVLKIDDDVVINMYNFVYFFLHHMKGKTKSIFCYLFQRGRMPIMRTGKWGIKKHQFSTSEVYPYNYCSGFVVVITTDLISPMYEASKKTPFFWIDDIYLFGILPTVVGNVTFYDYGLSQHIVWDDATAMKCIQENGQKCPIFATLIRNNAYWTYWKQIKEVYTTGDGNVQKILVH